MKRRVVGQGLAISKIANAIRRSCSPLADSGRPIGRFLFVGPTGVGKSELAKTLAEILFDDDEKLIQLDMSEYYDKHFISNLVGPTLEWPFPGGGVLTEAVKREPCSVVLFDEIEKAHPDVLRLLLQIMDEGCLTDGFGAQVDFRKTVTIMTSSVGLDQINECKRSEFESQGGKQGKRIPKSEVDRAVKRELRKTLPPEFMNRIDEVVIFNPLSKENLRSIASLVLSKVKVEVEADEKVLDFLISARYDPTMGARPLRRTIEDLVVEPLAKELIRGKISEHDVVKLAVSDGKIIFRKKPVRRKEGEKKVF